MSNFTLVLFWALRLPRRHQQDRHGASARLANLVVLIITAASVVPQCVRARHRPYLRLIAFIVVIASMVQIVEMAIKKLSSTPFGSLGIYPLLITTNCAILGLAMFQTNRAYTFVQGQVFAVGAGLGSMLALVLMASIREKLAFANVPAIAKGTALTSSSPAASRWPSWACRPGSGG